MIDLVDPQTPNQIYEDKKGVLLTGSCLLIVSVVV